MGGVAGLQCLGAAGVLGVEIGGLFLEIGVSGGGGLVVGGGGVVEPGIVIAGEGVDLGGVLGGNGFEGFVMLDAAMLELGDEGVLFPGKGIALGVRGLQVALMLGSEIVDACAVFGGEGVEGFLVGGAQGVLGFAVAKVHAGEGLLMIVLALGEACEDFLFFLPGLGVLGI